MTLVSRSAIVTRKQCEMKRYVGYEFRGTGVQPKDFTQKAGHIGMAALPKVRGAIFHNLSLAIVQGAEPSDWQPLLKQQIVLLPEEIQAQQLVLIRRAMLGWELIRGKQWRQDFDVISAEESWQWPLTPNISEPLRMDKIIRRKDDRSLGIFDYKTMGNSDPNWVHRLELSDQTHLYVQALKERTDEWILGICYDGVVIGKIKDGVQRSPFVVGYMKNGKVSPKWSAGSTLIELKDYSDEKWLDWIQGTDGLNDLYQTTGFLSPPTEVMLHTKASIGRAEEEYLDRVSRVENVREVCGEDSIEFRQALALIEKNPDQCLKYGVDYACSFVGQCWHGWPLDEQFEPRVNHHQEGEE
jgi:hypothetical protein